MRPQKWRRLRAPWWAGVVAALLGLAWAGPAVAASGMLTEQLNTDNIAHNLANVNTTGFKKARMNFQDLFYQTLREAGTPVTQGAAIPVPLQVGLGVRPVANTKIFMQGNMVQTGRDLDLAPRWSSPIQVRRARKAILARSRPPLPSL